jgi:hypothetical protein
MESPALTIKKMLMQTTLIANLNTLKVYIPEIYEEFKNYQPGSSGVAIDENEEINLFNNDSFVYDNPKSFAQEQVELYLKDPAMLTFAIDNQEDKDMLFDHPRILKKISQKCQSDVKQTLKRPIDESRIDFICMIGAGLGYQIEELYRQKNVVNFLLCEPSKDTFYAMLHCIDLKALIEKSSSLGGRFLISVGGSAANIINAVSIMLHHQGHFNLSRMFFYRHYQSDSTVDTMRLIHEIGHRWASGWGFMEDEIISITHTLSNIQAGFKICNKTALINNKIATRPVFIVANGPSFDSSVDFLQKNADKVIIVSCGTVLKALLANNIKPDIHVEMERTAALLPYIDVIEEQQRSSDIKLKDIQIVALNTVYTELLNRFKSPLLLTKLSDGGGKLIQQFDKLDTYAAPDYSNPTVSNTAVTLITTLGFKEIYLIGLDFGYKSNKHHHSKDSIYYNGKYDYVGYLEEEMTVEGNLSETVFTTPIFDSSKGNVEMHLQQMPLLNVYNCSDGAKIAWTKPTPLGDIDDFSSFDDKELAIAELLENAFDNKQFTAKKLDHAVKQSFNEVSVILEQLMNFISMDISTREELYQQFTLQNSLLMELKGRKEYQVSYWLIQGTFRYFQASIMTHCYFYDDAVERKAFIKFCLKEFRTHIKSLNQELQQSYNKPSKA